MWNCKYLGHLIVGKFIFIIYKVGFFFKDIYRETGQNISFSTLLNYSTFINTRDENN